MGWRYSSEDDDNGRIGDDTNDESVYQKTSSAINCTAPNWMDT